MTKAAAETYLHDRQRAHLQDLRALHRTLGQICHELSAQAFASVTDPGGTTGSESPEPSNKPSQPASDPNDLASAG